MTIERLHLGGSVTAEVPPDLNEKERQQLILNIIEENQEKIVTLPPGEYDLTPKGPEDDPYTYNLLVFGNGTAAYRIMLRQPSASGLSGRQIGMPKDDDFVMLVESLGDRQRVKIHEIILWLPG